MGGSGQRCSESGIVIPVFHPGNHNPGFSSRESGVFWDEIGSKPFPRCRIPGIPTFIPKKTPSEKVGSSDEQFQVIQEFLFHTEFHQNPWERWDPGGIWGVWRENLSFSQGFPWIFLPEIPGSIPNQKTGRREHKIPGFFSPPRPA